MYSTLVAEEDELADDGLEGMSLKDKEMLDAQEKEMEEARLAKIKRKEKKAAAKKEKSEKKKKNNNNSKSNRKSFDQSRDKAVKQKNQSTSI